MATRFLTLALLLAVAGGLVAVSPASAFDATRSAGFASYNHPKYDKWKDKQIQRHKAMAARKQQ
jgi:hypothetical protein